MQDVTRILILHRDRSKAAKIVSTLMSGGQIFDIKVINTAMEGVPEYARFQPHAFIVETGLIELPVPALAKALRQMDPMARIILCGDEVDMKLRGEAEAIGAVGCFAIPPQQASLLHLITAEPGTVMPAPVSSSGEQQVEDDRTLTGGINPFWRERATSPEPRKLNASELSGQEQFHHKGPLRVKGDLERVGMLHVDGSLAVEGNIISSKVFCNGPIIVSGRIQDCTRGIFSRDVIDVRGIVNSLVVCGKNLWLGEFCMDSHVVVVQRLVGKRAESTISGGRVRVGEHLSIGTLGDSENNLTRIEMAPELLREVWTRAKIFQWHLMQAQNPRNASSKAQLFEKQVRNPWFFRVQSELIARRIFPCIDLTIGDEEDFLFQHYREPTRVGLVPKRGNKGFKVVIGPKEKWQKKTKPAGAHL